MRRLKRLWFNPWVKKIPCRRAWQPTLVFLSENPVDRGAWQATVHRVTKSQTQLKQLSSHAYTYIYIYIYIYVIFFFPEVKVYR